MKLLLLPIHAAWPAEARPNPCARHSSDLVNSQACKRFSKWLLVYVPTQAVWAGTIFKSLLCTVTLMLLQLLA